MSDPTAGTPPWARDTAPVPTAEAQEQPSQSQDEQSQGGGEQQSAPPAETPVTPVVTDKPAQRNRGGANPAIRPAEKDKQMPKKTGRSDGRPLLKVGDHMPLLVLHLISRGMSIGDAIAHYNNREED